MGFQETKREFLGWLEIYIGRIEANEPPHIFDQAIDVERHLLRLAKELGYQRGPIEHRSEAPEKMFSGEPWKFRVLFPDPSNGSCRVAAGGVGQAERDENGSRSVKKYDAYWLGKFKQDAIFALKQWRVHVESLPEPERPLSMEEICEAIPGGLSPKTVRNWMAKDPANRPPKVSSRPDTYLPSDVRRFIVAKKPELSGIIC